MADPAKPSQGEKKGLWSTVIMLARRLAIFGLLLVIAVAAYRSLKPPTSKGKHAVGGPVSIATAAERAAALERQLAALRREYAATLERAVSAEAKVAERDQKLVTIERDMVDGDTSTVPPATAMTTPASRPAPSTARPLVEADPGAACVPGCTTHGNCDAVSGECACPFTHGGKACDEPHMPSCALDDRETLNLSFLASEEAWQPLRDVSAVPGEDARRTSPPALWIGPIPCECVLESVQALSLQTSPMAHQWPPFIEFPFLSMQRVPCIDAPRGMSVGRLWAHGGLGGGGRSAPLPWAYVPVFGFLKQFPAHAPMLLPSGFVTEAAYMHPPGRAIDLDFHAPPPKPVVTALEHLLPGLRGVALRLLPQSQCAPHGCDGVGWCDGSAAHAPPRCRCAAGMMGKRGLSSLRRGGQHGAEGGAGARNGRVVGCVDKAARRHVKGLFAGGAGGAAGAGERDPDRLGPDRWRQSIERGHAVRQCPNGCSGHGRGHCHYGFCHCQAGFWGLDCGFSVAKHVRSRTGGAHPLPPKPRIYVHPLPPALRRSCNWWHLGEDLGERLLASDHAEADPANADLFWVYGCPNGDTILPAIRWIRQRGGPWWNSSVTAGAPRHVLVVGHEEGWAEVWRYLVHWLRGPTGDHANHHHTWDELHPASPTRQLAIVQLSGKSDYPAAGERNPIRCVSSDAPCYVCFQPGKDVMVPAHPGLIVTDEEPSPPHLPWYALPMSPPLVPRGRYPATPASSTTPLHTSVIASSPSTPTRVGCPLAPRPRAPTTRRCSLVGPCGRYRRDPGSMSRRGSSCTCATRMRARAA